MRWTTRSILLLGLLTTICVADLTRVVAQDVLPLQLHPDNDRYFLFRDKPTVLVTSAEHYGVLLNRAFEFEPYFDELASHGLNLTRVFSGAYREVEGSFGITENPLAPSEQNFICPWKRSGKTHADGSAIYDLDTWDEAYFERLAALMRAASKRGIVVEMCLFSPMYKPVLWEVNPMNARNNVNDIGAVDSQEVFTTKHKGLLAVQARLASKMVEALQPHDNVYIEVCNEPYFGGVTDAWQRHVIDTIVAKQRQIGSRQLISVNVANGSKTIVDPHSAISIFNFHYCHPPKVVGENEHVHGVIGENETGFRGSQDFLYRTEGWDFLVAGGGLYNNLDYSFSASHPAGTLTGYASPGGGSRSLRRQLSILKSTFERLPVPDIRPLESGFVVAPDGWIASAIGQPGHAYLIYVHVELPGRIKDQSIEPFTRTNQNVRIKLKLPEGHYHVTQIDTQSGMATVGGNLTAAGDTHQDVELRQFTTDTALLIESSGAGQEFPGAGVDF